MNGNCCIFVWTCDFDRSEKTTKKKNNKTHLRIWRHLHKILAQWQRLPLFVWTINGTLWRYLITDELKKLFPKIGQIKRIASAWIEQNCYNLWVIALNHVYTDSAFSHCRWILSFSHVKQSGRRQSKINWITYCNIGE